jgi:hypothetical protein
MTGNECRPKANYGGTDLIPIERVRPDVPPFVPRHLRAAKVLSSGELFVPAVDDLDLTYLAPELQAEVRRAVDDHERERVAIERGRWKRTKENDRTRQREHDWLGVVNA